MIEHSRNLRTVSTGQAARILGLLSRSGQPNPRAVQRYIRLGLLEALRYGRGYRIPMDALRGFQERSRA